MSPQRRGLALGAWGGVAGLAVAGGPLVGGAVVQGISWQGISWHGISWQGISWLNVPIGLAVLPLAITRLTETTGPNRSLDLPGLGLVSAGLFSLVFGLVRASEHGWGSLGVAGPLAAGAALVAAFVLAGVGMSLFFAPTANVVLSAVRRDEEGKASGVNNTMREIGGVFGVAVLATVFSAVGSYASPSSFVDGLTSATWVGAAAVGLAALSSLAIPGRRRLAPQGEPESPEVAEREPVKVG